MFPYVSDHELLKFAVKECGEKLVDIRGLHPDLIYKRHKPPKIKNWVVSKYGYLVRESVAKKLVRIVKDLPGDFQLIVNDGYRPVEVQRKMFHRMIRHFGEKKKYSHLSKEELKIKVLNYVADPDSYTYHSTGGVVDVHPAIDGKEISMGKALHTFDNRVSKKARKNRTILIRAMQKEGFVNYPLEWWHWCYGESLWAYVNKKKYAIYGKIQLKDLKRFIK
ncbi:MAG TPA: M15 family metallopeptidase [Nanoarchaeota archaeon]|nr:D-alanyl-D-alanine carboxypeptidase family protein [Candidatus Pacearchaeota archaeon]HIH17897.1 M15 family metallopeptidase [Nanoarchaeota archaeon]HIH33732.1 M15 family metallopeptidase [Nanoarchaeota archaeon]HIH51317.1 M15 family metallopeptidase [Nanoarchaeota archaeon]HIH66403.1 M15 family metallopeptidase [Nanoarchaeota archaeon]